MSDTPTTAPVTVEVDGPVLIARLDDGKANAVTHEVAALLSEALDRAEAEGARALVLAGRPGRFSAGFDLATMRSGPGEARDLLRVGLQLALRLYEMPLPVVAAATGHALAMGAILLLSSDVRIGAEGDFKVGLNEVAIGMPVPSLAVELARGRLSPGHLARAVNLAELYDPAGAVAAGYLDELAPGDLVVDRAVARAHELAAALNPGAFAATRASLRGEIADGMRDRLQQDVASFTVDG